MLLLKLYWKKFKDTSTFLIENFFENILIHYNRACSCSVSHHFICSLIPSRNSKKKIEQHFYLSLTHHLNSKWMVGVIPAKHLTYTHTHTRIYFRGKIYKLLPCHVFPVLPIQQKHVCYVCFILFFIPITEFKWCGACLCEVCVCVYVCTNTRILLLRVPYSTARMYVNSYLYALLMMLRMFALALKSKYQQSLCLLAQHIFVSCVSVLWCYCCCFWLQNKTLW